MYSSCLPEQAAVESTCKFQTLLSFSIQISILRWIFKLRTEPTESVRKMKYEYIGLLPNQEQSQEFWHEQLKRKTQTTSLSKLEVLIKRQVTLNVTMHCLNSLNRLMGKMMTMKKLQKRFITMSNSMKLLQETTKSLSFSKAWTKKDTLQRIDLRE